MFLENALIPLHKPRSVALYHPQLSYCISQYVEKDPDTLIQVVRGLVKYWPWTCASKQVLFLSELEEILELCRGDQLGVVQDELFQLLANCIGSSHFQVVERTLYLWNSETLMSNVLHITRAASFLPRIFGPLSKCSTGHWNQTVEGLSHSVMKIYLDGNLALYDKCSREFSDKSRALEAERTAAAGKWASLRQDAVDRGVELIK